MLIKKLISIVRLRSATQLTSKSHFPISVTSVEQTLPALI